MKTKYLTDKVSEKVANIFGISLEEANRQQLYNACALTINDILLNKRTEFNSAIKNKKAKMVYYLSMEFLLGKSLKNNIYNLDLEKPFNEMLTNLGFSLEELYQEEPDAGLGNGGLGRLGACYLDALASLSYPAVGYSLRYEYGLFKQKIDEGWQNELPDCWLPGGAVWLNERSDKIYPVMFNGTIEERHSDGKTFYDYKDFNEIDAIAYDVIISGADSGAVSVLRLWRSKSICNFDISSFSHGDYYTAMQGYCEADLITKVLYPADNHYQGKILRLKQQYLLASASIQDIVNEFLNSYGDIRLFGDYVAIHINDTHPTLAIVELMRILLDQFNLSFSEAWEIVNKTFAYTNHTVMAEALEKWPVDLLQNVIPRIYVIIEQINNHFVNEAKTMGIDEDLIEHLAIINHGEVKMANLCVIASHTVNGVSKLHSNIIKNSIFKGYNYLYPHKFTNVTNGIAYRRWLNQSNRALSSFLNELIGSNYYKNSNDLENLLEYKDNEQVLEKLAEIKHHNKILFADDLYREKGIVIDPNTRFDVQVKRIHEYKRQLLNALKIIALIIELEEKPDTIITPQTFIFGGKAAPGYYMAKQIIELIVNLSMEIDRNPRIKSMINVVFLEEYNVTLAERLFPASEVSQQISLAGKEASGTGNMKFMINGAITLGTLDGANVEIFEAVGKENMFIFGMRAEEVNELRKRGYNPHDIYAASPTIIKVIDRLNKGFNNRKFDNISRYLLTNFPVSDPFMCLADFDSYMNAHNTMDQIYQDEKRWNRMSLINITHAGIFAADRSIEEYSKRIWNLEKIDI